MSGGGAAVGTILEGIADIGTLVLGILDSVFSMQATEEAQKEARKMWRISRQDEQKQLRITNQLNQDRLDLDRAGLNLSRLQFRSQEKAQTRVLAEQKREWDEKMKVTENQNAITNMLNFVNNNEGIRNNILQRMAA